MVYAAYRSPFLDSADITLKSELPVYIAAAEDVSDSIDSLRWWRMHQDQLPHWASMGSSCIPLVLLKWAFVIHIETKQPLFTEAAKDAGRGGGGGGREEEEPRTVGAVLAGGLMAFFFTHFTFTPFPKNSFMKALCKNSTVLNLKSQFEMRLTLMLNFNEYQGNRT